MQSLRKSAIILATSGTMTVGASAAAVADPGAQSPLPTASDKVVWSARTVTPETGSNSGSDAGTRSPANSATRTTGAGYSWRVQSSQRKKVGGQRNQRFDPTRPQAKGPEFVLTRDGLSRVTVQLSRHVDVVVSSKRREYTFALRNVQVAVQNDKNPLVTTHFSTPIANVKLRSKGNDAELIISLREPASPHHDLRDAPDGTTILEVTVPKSTRSVNAHPPNQIRGEKHRKAR